MTRRLLRNRLSLQAMRQGLRAAGEALRKARVAEPLEFEQMIVRYVVGLIITAYAIFSFSFENLPPRSAAILAALLISAWAFAFCLMAHLAIWTARTLERRLASICADAVALSLLLAFGEKSAAVFFPVYLWVTLGNGFRFGINFMYTAIAVNLTGFCVMVAYTPYWRESWQFSVGLALAIIVIPLYVAKLIRNLRSAMKEAEAASHAKTEFLSMISHELRTPLNAILGLAQISKATAESARERFSAMSTELAASRLLRMVDTILKFQRIESGMIDRIDRPFDFLDILNEVRAIIEPLARQKGLHFGIRFLSVLPPRLQSDPDHIQTIMLNLLTNAVKYTPEGSVSLDIELLSRKGGALVLRLAVRDTGTGIAPAARSRIFERFVRGEDHNVSSEPGVGLGLSVCKSLADILGGELGLESAYGKGSLFWAELPVSALGEEAEARQDEGASQAPILWVGVADPAWIAAFPRSRAIVSAGVLNELVSADTPLSAHLVVLVSKGLDPSLRAALLAAIAGADRRPALILVEEDGAALEDFHPYAAASVKSLQDKDLPGLIDMLSRWQGLAGAHLADAPRPVRLTRSLTVLVADDNALNRNVIRQMLEMDGHRVLLASDGDEALQLLLDGEPDLALLDVNMPGLSGLDVCRAYRTGLGGGARIPLIGLTADISEPTRESCLKAGMSEMLSKPLSLDELRRVLAEWIERHAWKAQVLRGAPNESEAHPIADPERIAFLRGLFPEGAFEGQFLASFRKDTLSSLEDLRQAIGERRPQLIRAAIHAIMSSASTAGAREILDLTGRFQADWPAESLEDFDRRVREALDRYCAFVRNGKEPKAGARRRLSAAS